MIHLSNPTARRIAAIAGLAAVAACSTDQVTSPLAERASSGPSLLTYDYDPTVGTVRACNFSQGVGFLVPPVTITTTATSGSVVSPAVVPQDACEIVWTGSSAASVTVTQNAMPGLSTMRIATITTTPTVQYFDNPSQPASTTVSASGAIGVSVWFKNAYGQVPPPPPPPPPAGGDGCTPGFWKNSPGSWVGYSTGQTFASVFGTNAMGTSLTLMQALNLGGGGKNALARHATAALLGAAHPSVDYDASVADVIADTRAAMNGGDVNGTKNMFEAFNELGCPLANDNSF